jgi:hypothetical protein
MSSQKKVDLPFHKWYWAEWFASDDVQVLHPTARCIWFEMIGLMWQSSERGYLIRNDKPLPLEKLSRILRFDNLEEFKIHFQAVEDAGLFSRRVSDGAIFSRKILHDLEIYEQKAEAGRKGAKATWSRVAKAGAKASAIARQDVRETDEEGEDEDLNTSGYPGEPTEEEKLAENRRLALVGRA